MKLTKEMKLLFSTESTFFIVFSIFGWLIFKGMAALCLILGYLFAILILRVKDIFKAVLITNLAVLFGLMTF